MKQIRKTFFALLAVVMLCFSAQASANQCDSVVLDLVCSPGMVLQGIDSDGNKICVDNMSFGGFYVLDDDRTTCRKENSYTGDCSCPANYVGEFAPTGKSGDYRNYTCVLNGVAETCEPGSVDSQTQACGTNGHQTRTRTCNASGTGYGSWSAWGTCITKDNGCPEYNPGGPQYYCP